MDLIRRRYSSTTAAPSGRANGTARPRSSASGISSADYGGAGKTEPLRKRVSSVFSPLRKRASVASGASYASSSEAAETSVVAGNVAALGYLIREQDSDTESTDSIDDIRRPSGLGRTASFSSDRSPPSFAWTLESTEQQDQPRLHHSISSPSLLHGLAKRIRSARDRSPGVNSLVPRFPLPPRHRVFDVPMEVLICIMSHLPRDSVARAAVVARGFSEAAQTVLYGRIDLRTVRPSRQPQLLALLASRPQLTELVQTFICHNWPETEPPDEDNSVTSHPPALAHLAIALQNMPNLITLALPSFDVDVLRRHTAFGLRNLTFFNTVMAKEDRQALFNWLDGQINIVSFRLPELFDETQEGEKSSLQASLSAPTHALLASPLLSPVSPSSPISPMSPTFSVRGPEPYSYESPTLLPALRTLHAPPSLAASLAPSRRLRRATINVDATLYTGLRPAALVAPLKGVQHLGLRFGRHVDRRSMEKVLSAAGATLGGMKSESPLEDAEPVEGVQSLTVYITSPDPGVDEVLYKIIHSVISRYCHLTSLALNCVPATDEDFADFRSGTSTPDSARPGSPGMASSLMERPSSVMFPSHDLVATPILSTAPIITSSPSRLSHKERLHINSWVKLCPTMRVVKLLSGAEWRA
ncbi:hypothetical protein K523DRAFT_363171 [Schizophyllum commune Tattone D]|nr:hypothetical protein K523DRAFT_363171 [Schizophyllum commune Tattone D]